jgi:hypothetical protein
VGFWLGRLWLLFLGWVLHHGQAFEGRLCRNEDGTVAIVPVKDWITWQGGVADGGGYGGVGRVGND